ncbi:MAG: aspartate aminotransferase family protein [Desulfurococcaceae archaeon]|nr:aspartate aminotransferase family protein [Desulfurococcaceae archaeon]
MSMELSSRILDVVERDKRVFPRGISLKYSPLVVESARKWFIRDIEGREFIDFVSGAVVYPIGHLHEDVVNAIKSQLEKYLGYPIVYFYAREPIDLAEKLINITPGNFEKKVFLGFSGSDAVEVAILVSRAAKRAKYVVSFYDSFHGSLYMTFSASGIFGEDVKRAVLASSDIILVPYPNPYRNPYGIDGYEKPVELSNIVLRELEKIFISRSAEISSILLEPIQGDGGIVIPPEYFIRELGKLCSEHGILLVDDEVKTGVGRTGKWWGIEHYGVIPDLLVTGKGLGSGMPISAVIGRADVMDSYPEGGLGYTLSGHTLSAIAALATLKVIERDNLIERARDLGSYIIKRLREMSEQFEIIGDVRGKGLLIGVEIVRDKVKKTPDKPRTLKILWRAWEKGLILLAVGKYGNVVRIAPPLNIPREVVDKALEIIEESIRDVLEGRVPDTVLTYMRGW